MTLKRTILLGLLALPVWAFAENSLVGQWVMPVPNNAQCSEFYHFDANGQFQVQSNQERVTGRYEVVENGGLPQLNFAFTQDNQMVDCFGNNVDQTNTTDRNFMKWQNENLVEWCSDATGQNCPVKLYRQ